MNPAWWIGVGVSLGLILAALIVILDHHLTQWDDEDRETFMRWTQGQRP